MKTPIEFENKVGRVKLDDVVTKGLIDPLIDKIATLYGDDAVRNQWTNGDVVAVAEDALETLVIDIDSRGGSVAEGYRLFKTLKALRERGVEVVANITKQAASMGSVIAMAADKVLMADRAVFMIHDASLAVSGDAAVHRQAVSDLEAISDELAGLYAAKTGIPQEKIRNAMKSTVYLNAQGSLKYGFVDEVYETPKKDWNPSILERLIGNIDKAENVRAVSQVDEFDVNAKNLHLQSECDSDNHETKMFNKSKDLEDKLIAAQADVTRLEAELLEAQSLASEAADKDQRIAELSESVAQFEASLESEKTAHAETVKALEAEQAKTTPEAIQAIVTEELAKASHEPVEDDENDDKPKASLYDQYRNLQNSDPRKAAEFWDKHSEAIKKGS